MLLHDWLDHRLDLQRRPFLKQLPIATRWRVWTPLCPCCRSCSLADKYRQHSDRSSACDKQLSICTVLLKLVQPKPTNALPVYRRHTNMYVRLTLGNFVCMWEFSKVYGAMWVCLQPSTSARHECHEIQKKCTCEERLAQTGAEVWGSQACQRLAQETVLLVIHSKHCCKVSQAKRTAH